MGLPKASLINAYNEAKVTVVRLYHHIYILPPNLTPDRDPWTYQVQGRNLHFGFAAVKKSKRGGHMRQKARACEGEKARIALREGHQDRSAQVNGAHHGR